MEVPSSVLPYRFVKSELTICSHTLSIARFTQPFRQLLQIKPADMGSYVNYFIERKNGDVAGDDPEFVPPMVGESEVVFTTVEAVPVRGRIRSSPCI